MFSYRAWSAWTALLYVAVLAMALPLRAQEYRPDQGIYVLPSTAPGAPSASDIVTWYYTPAGKRSPTPPLQALTVGSPALANYLLPLRAEGDLLARLSANPTSARAKLERYIVVWYPAGTDRSIPLAALQADPYVSAAYLVPDGEFTSVALTGFDVIGSGPPLPPAGLGQYGREDMNVDAAWNLAGGFALIQVIDSGLYEEHPALRQFQGANFVGGELRSSRLAGHQHDRRSGVSSRVIDERRRAARDACARDLQS